MGLLSIFSRTAPKAAETVAESAHVFALSNARFERVSHLNLVSILDDATNNPTAVHLGFDKLQAVAKSFDDFVSRFRDSELGVHVRSRRHEAHQVFDEAVIPSLQDAGVRVIDAKNYVNSTMGASYDLKMRSRFSLGKDAIDLNDKEGMKMFLSSEAGRDLSTALKALEHKEPSEILSADNWRATIANHVVDNKQFHALLENTAPIDGALAPMNSFKMTIPLRNGVRGFVNSRYDAHARFEETAHFFQYANEQSLTTYGKTLETSILQQDPKVIAGLTKKWETPGAVRRLVRENDIAGVYKEFDIPTPGIFNFYYDRRAVVKFFATRNALD